MTGMCGNVKAAPYGKIHDRCPNKAGEGSMFCDACKAQRLAVVRSMRQPGPYAGLRWPTKTRA